MTRAAALLLLLVFNSLALAQNTGDMEILKSAAVAIDSAKLLPFLKNKVPDTSSRAATDKWLAQWQNGNVAEQKQAAAELIALGPAALPALKRARMLASAELTTVIDDCIAKIASNEVPEVIAAAARVLAERQPEEAIEVLVQYIPFVSDLWLEDALLHALGAASIRNNKVDDRLLAALKGPAPQRAIAGSVLATYGGFAERALVRSLFTDPDASVRQHAAAGLIGKTCMQQLRDTAAADEALLTAQRVSVETTALFAFLRSRIVEEGEEQHIKKLIRDLGADTYSVRMRAGAALSAKGTAVLGYLHEAERNADLEVARRVRLCIDEINRGPGPALPIAAIHRLLSADPHPRAPAGELIRVLLEYIPFADDSVVEEEVIHALSVAAVRESHVEPRLLAALSDARPARRGAAAFVLGQTGTEECVPLLAKLLQDEDATVRLRAAIGLLTGHDTRAVATLIDLLNASDNLSWLAEESLQRLAGETAPLPSADAAPDVQRKQRPKLWQDWWQKQNGDVVWARLHQANVHQGLLTIAEYEAARGRNGGRIWERGPDGTTRWLFDVHGAMDAQVLPNGRVLVAENIANRITERDKKGAIKWEYPLTSNPVGCQRLANGNTFIATYNELLELTPDGKPVYTHKRGPAFFIFSAQKLPTGRIVCMTAQGNVLEIDARTGKDVRTFNVVQAGGWCSVEVLPNGRYLIATMIDNMVREMDAEGRTYWSCEYPGAFRATRLPNGNTVVASMGTRKIGEFDRAGKLRSEINCEGRPWSVRSR